MGREGDAGLCQIFERNVDGAFGTRERHEQCDTLTGDGRAVREVNGFGSEDRQPLVRAAKIARQELGLRAFEGEFEREAMRCSHRSSPSNASPAANSPRAVA